MKTGPFHCQAVPHEMRPAIYIKFLLPFLPFLENSLLSLSLSSIVKVSRGQRVCLVCSRMHAFHFLSTLKNLLENESEEKAESSYPKMLHI